GCSVVVPEPLQHRCKRRDDVRSRHGSPPQTLARAGEPAGKGRRMLRPERSLSPLAACTQHAIDLLTPSQGHGSKEYACRTGTGRGRVRGCVAGKRGGTPCVTTLWS